MANLVIAWELAGAHWVTEDVQWPVCLRVEMVGRGEAFAELDAPELLARRRGEGRVRRERRLLRYQLAFEGGWRLSAEQHLSLWGSPMPFTLVEGELWHPDREVRHLLRLRFDVRSDLPRALMTSSSKTLSRLRLDR